MSDLYNYSHDYAFTDSKTRIAKAVAKLIRVGTYCVWVLLTEQVIILGVNTLHMFAGG